MNEWFEAREIGSHFGAVSMQDLQDEVWIEAEGLALLNVIEFQNYLRLQYLNG